MLHQSVIRPPALTGSADDKAAQTRSYLAKLADQIQNVFDSIGSNDYSAEFAQYTSDISALQKAVKTKAGRAALTDAKEETSKALAIQANDILILQAGVGENAASITLANGRIDAQALSINLHAQDILTLQAGVDENAAKIEITNGSISAIADDILLKADKIDLVGLVTATELQANYAKIADLNSVAAQISSLTSGLTTATIINAGTVNGTQVNGTYGSFDALTHNGSLVSQRAITMGSLSSVGKALSTGGALDLQHSHKVTLNEDGSVTLGEVSATGGNFNIADTKVYKDGVSAAANGVTLSKKWANGIFTVTASNGKSATTAISKGTQSLNGDTYSIPIMYDTNGTTGYTITVNAYERYKAGWNECRAAAGSKKCLINYYPAGETLYDRDGNVASGPWYKGTETTLYTLPSART